MEGKSETNLKSRTERRVSAEEVLCFFQEAEDLVRTRKVRPITYQDLHKALTAEGEGNAYTMLDVRPEWEHAKAHSPSSLHVPLFVEVKKAFLKDKA